MCGICGIYGEHDRETITRMADTMAHRGPDDSGSYSDGVVGLGHRRLSIVDLSERGHQPMSNEDGSVWMVVNGEIYNHRELRRTLGSLGHRFCSDSDSETIVHAYEHYGMDFLHKLRGMFALALYDRTKGTLVLARDPMGKKPLYTYCDRRRLLFASEVKALLAAGVPRVVNQTALQGYLMYQYSVGRETLFQGVRKVLAGEIWVYDGEHLRVSKYWDLPSRTEERADYPSRLRDALDDSVRLRMQADVPVGSFLSGGIDSAAVTALAMRYSSEPLHTFSVGFDTFSELPWARRVSEHLGTKHHEVVVTPDMVADSLEKVAWHFDEPVGDAATVCNYFLSQEAHRSGLKVVVAGEGGDELFGGYQHYRIGSMVRPLYWLPPQVRSLGRGLLRWFPGDGSWGKLNRARHLALFLLQPTFRDAHDYMTQTMNEEEVEGLTGLGPDWYCSPMVPAATMTDPLNQALAWDCKNLLPEKFLMKADKATMANSVEERLPLLDREVVELAFSMPGSWKIRNGQEKYVLRRAVADLLPEEIVNRKKQGFGTPVGHWLRYPRIKERVLSRLHDGALSKELFDQKALSRLLGTLDNGTASGLASHFTDGAIWTIFALQLWHDVFFERSARCGHQHESTEAGCYPT